MMAGFVWDKFSESAKKSIVRSLSRGDDDDGGWMDESSASSSSPWMGGWMDGEMMPFGYGRITLLSSPTTESFLFFLSFFLSYAPIILTAFFAAACERLILEKCKLI